MTEVLALLCRTARAYFCVLNLNWIHFINPSCCNQGNVMPRIVRSSPALQGLCSTRTALFRLQGLWHWFKQTPRGEQHDSPWQDATSAIFCCLLTFLFSLSRFSDSLSTPFDFLYFSDLLYFFPPHWLVSFLHALKWRDTRERQRRVIGRGSKREGDNRPFVEKLSRPKCPVSSLCSVYSSLGHSLCVLVVVMVIGGWGGCCPLCQPVSVPLHKPQWTDRVSYDPDALVTTADLKYLPWAGPGLTFFLSLCLCQCLSLSDAHCHSPRHPTLFF